MFYGDKKLNYINTFCRDDLKDTKKPLFLYIHGGGWISGITEMRNPYITNWAELGFYCASISYSYAPQEVFPTQIKEIFTAIDYIVDHAEGLNIDTENVVIAGESAGGYYITFVSHCLSHPEVLEKLGIEFRNADKIKMILQDHDEIIFECDEQLATHFANMIKTEMENVVKLSVPLIAEAIISPIWDK